jgi:dihydrofolate reductase
MKITEREVKEILIKNFGQPLDTKTTQLKFNCPSCKEENFNCVDNKYNLEIKIVPDSNRDKKKIKTHCWKCDEVSLFRLFKKYGNIKDFKLLLDYEPNLVKKKEKDLFVKLPKEYIKITSKNFNNSEVKPYYVYLIKRGLNIKTIEKYNIGYCGSGYYSNRVVFPSYDCNKKLNYFTTRTILDNVKPKGLNPLLSKEEIIFNEGLINFNSTVYLVEGIFEYFSLPINTVNLLGKAMYFLLLSKLIKYKPNVVICLNRDALYAKNKRFSAPQSSIQIAENLLDNNITNVKILLMPTDNDLNDTFIKGGKSSIKDLLENNLFTLEEVKNKIKNNDY